MQAMQKTHDPTLWGIDELPDATALIDNDGYILMPDDALCELLGVAPDILRHQPLDWYYRDGCLDTEITGLEPYMIIYRPAPVGWEIALYRVE